VRSDDMAAKMKLVMLGNGIAGARSRS